MSRINIALTCILILLFWPIATTRFIAGDEGYYILAAQEILLGKTLYKDFFYPQMPLLPYLLAGWSSIFGVGWLTARIFALLLSVGSAILVFAIARKQSGKVVAGVIALVLFVGCDLVFGYFPVLKTYGLSVFATLLAIHLFRFGPLAAGVCLGLAVLTRLQFLALAPIFIVWDLRNALRFIAGLILGLFPAVLFYIAGPDQFIFNNLTYHSIRNREGLITGFPQKLEMLWNLSGQGDYVGAISYQFGLLVIMALALALWQKRFGLPLFVGLALTLVSFLPTPVYSQYFCVAVPFFAIELAQGLSLIKKNYFAVVFLIVYMFAAPAEYLRYTVTGALVPGVASKSGAEHWDRKNIEAAQTLINSITKPGEQVITTWPGYLVGTHAQVYPGLENHFAISIAHKLNAEKRTKYHVISRDELDQSIENSSTRIVILGYRAERKRLKAALNNGGYQRMKTDLSGIRIFISSKLPSKLPPTP